MEAQEIKFKRITNDVNGNPRYVTHFYSLLKDNEDYDTSGVLLSIDNKYNLALVRAKGLGGKRYHNKQFGGGIVFQSYNTGELSKRIKEELRDR